MSQRIWSRSLLVTSLIAITISALSIGWEWNTSGQLTTSLSAAAIALVLGAACLSYTLRILRFHLLLSQSGIPISLGNTALAQGVGFALSVTPGSVGEVFKLELIKERARTPLLRAAPVLLLDRMMEGAGFLVLALALPLALPTLQEHVPNLDFLVISFGLVLLLVLLRNPLARLVKRASAGLTRFALVRRLRPYSQNLWQGLVSSLAPRQIVTGLGLTALARVSDGLVLFFAAQMLGVALALPLAIFVLALSGFAGGISLLPGGAGAVETTMVGLLVLAGASFPTALAITLLARLSTLWLWVGLGLALALILQLAPKRIPHVLE